MEIIHIILGKANPNRMNGVNKVVNNLASTQSILGYQVSVWGITSSLEEDFPARPYKTVLFPALKNKFRISQKLIRQAKSVDKKTIFHIHGGFIPEFFHVARALKKLNLTYVFTPHGAYNVKAMERNKWVKKIYFNLFDRFVANNAKSLHCIGQSEVIATERLTPQANCVLIPNGQNLEGLKHPVLDQRKIPVFGFCGRIDIHTKGLDLLLEGFAEFSRQPNGDGELWIIGDGSELPILKALAQDLGIEKKVKFLGKKFGQEKFELMANMDAFYHPSRNEGLPGAVLEAAGMKTPCVVSLESNMAGYISQHNAGIALSECTAEQITRSMENVQEAKLNGSILSWKNNALDMVKKEFDWKNIARRLAQVYQK